MQVPYPLYTLSRPSPYNFSQEVGEPQKRKGIPDLGMTLGIIIVVHGTDPLLSTLSALIHTTTLLEEELFYRQKTKHKGDIKPLESNHQMWGMGLEIRPVCLQRLKAEKHQIREFKPLFCKTYLSPCLPPLLGFTKTSRGWVPGVGMILYLKR